MTPSRLICALAIHGNAPALRSVVRRHIGTCRGILAGVALPPAARWLIAEACLMCWAQA